jgi:hypothetical protein
MFKSWGRDPDVDRHENGKSNPDLDRHQNDNDPTYPKRTGGEQHIVIGVCRVSFETSFDSKQQKLEPKLVSALSETKRLFRLFRYYTETASFGVSIEPKQTEDQPKPGSESRDRDKLRNMLPTIYVLSSYRSNNTERFFFFY